MFSKYVRGMVYWANLPKYDVSPNAQQGMRPCIIVSNNVGNLFSKMVTVVPCTTNVDKPDLVTHYRIKLNSKEDSLVLCEMILTVNKDLLNGFMGILDETTMKHIDKCIEYSLGLIDVPEPQMIKQENTTNEEKLETKRKLNRGRRVSTKTDMLGYINYYENHSIEETMAEYGIPTKTAAKQRILYYRKKVK